MRTLAIVTLAMLVVVAAACAKAPAASKSAEQPVVTQPPAAPAAEPAAVKDVAQGIESVDTLSKDVENTDLDTLDSDLAIIDELG